MRLLNKANLELAELTEKDNYRGLNAIRVTGEFTEATDGKVLVRVGLPNEDPSDYPVIDGVPRNGDNPDVLIRQDQASALAKAIVRKTTLPILQHAVISVDGDKVIGATTDLGKQTILPTAGELRVNGNYPDTDAVIPPEDRPAVKVPVNAKILLQVLKYLVRYTEYPHQVTIEAPMKTSEALRLTAKTKHGQPVMALIMPLRHNETGE